MSQDPPAIESSTRPAGTPPGAFIFTYRNAMPVAFAVLLAVFALLQLLVPRLRVRVSAWELALGGLFTLLGVTLRLWCILQIGGSARKTSRPKANRIISWGPFSFVRNPIYVANMCVLWGFALLVAGIWALPPLGIVLGLWYDAIVRREEKFLEETHPEDYAEYRRYANRWIPRLQYRKRPAEVPPYPFLRALKRERGHIIAVSLGASAVILFRVLLGMGQG